MGNAARLLGIRPWEWDLMTVEETDMLLDWIEDYQRQIEESNARMR